MSFWLSGPKRIKEGPAGGAAAAAYCVCLHLQERTIPPDSSSEPGRDAALVVVCTVSVKLSVLKNSCLCLGVLCVSAPQREDDTCESPQNTENRDPVIIRAQKGPTKPKGP